MNEEIIFEFRLFLAFFLLGFIVLLTYDILSIFKLVLRQRRIPEILLEILFWVNCAFITFLLLYRMNYGIIRGFAALAALAGMFVYKKTFGRLYPENRHRRKRRKSRRGRVEENMTGKVTRKKRSRAGLRLIALMTLIICGVLIYAKLGVQKKYNEQLARQEDLLSQIDEAKEENKELQEYTLYMKTKKYVEDMARDILGLVYPDEIVIQPEE